MADIIEILERKTTIPEEGETFEDIENAFVEAVKEIKQLREIKRAVKENNMDALSLDEMSSFEARILEILED